MNVYLYVAPARSMMTDDGYAIAHSPISIRNINLRAAAKMFCSASFYVLFAKNVFLFDVGDRAPERLGFDSFFRIVHRSFTFPNFRASSFESFPHLF